ncbi:MAG TPA: serine/threonine-protein kinase, partial [Anaerolineales bacterium]
VYRAYDPSFDREVAIKVLPREFLHDPQFHDRFKREIKTIAALEHPAIVPVYDVGEDDGVPYFVMRYMTGGSLSSQIERGKFSMEDAARIIERLASALAYAHKKGIVHRDLKPDNILFDNNGDPFISDFGVAKFGAPTTNLTGSGIIGTPAYMSPEQAQGDKVDNRSDIYGLGVIIFQMLIGKHPYNADTPMGLAIKHVTEPVPEILKINPKLPAETDTVIKTAMAKNKDDRYASATDLSRALSHAAHGRANEATIPPTSAEGRGAGNRRGLLFVGLAVLVVALLAAFFFRDPIFAMIAPPPTATATAMATATKAPATPTTLPSATPEPTLTATIVPFAAFCQPDTVQIPTPAVVEKNRACANKFPFITVSIPLGAAFESLSPDMTCELTKTQATDELVTCTSKQSFLYQLQVCNPAPVIPASPPGKCAEGDSFDQANQCCLKPAASGAGCTIFEIAMKTCAE